MDIKIKADTKVVKPNAQKYFRRLSQLLLDLEVTDGKGSFLSLDKAVDKAIDLLLSVKAASHKVMLIGNGGSAAIASHTQNDLCKSVGILAMVFNETPILTAFSNDCGYESVFEQQIELWAKRGDILLAISSSGKSENILRAVRKANVRKCRIITLSGFDARNPLRRMGELNFYVPSQLYGYVELVHSALAHFLTDSTMSLRSMLTKRK